MNQSCDRSRSEITFKNPRAHEWAVILAGGDGTRLKNLTRQIAGDERPKQFCSVLGNGTLLEETRRRAAVELSPERTVYVVNRAHEKFYAPMLRREPRQNILVQPGNRGTAPAILYSALRIAAVDPQAVAAFFPSDHYVSDDARFMASVRTALDIAREKIDLVLLLGLNPETPEVEYGWIEPGAPIASYPQVFGVRRFWEKPNPRLAEMLQRRGCLWNSFVMVTSVSGLLNMIQSAIPELFHSFAAVSLRLGGPEEGASLNKLYEGVKEVNFSHQALALRPEKLAVLKVDGVRWNDLGEPKRVMRSLSMAGIRPHWAETGASQCG